MTHDELVEKVASHFEFPDKATTLVKAENILLDVVSALQEPSVLSDMRRAAIVAQGLIHNERLDYRELMDEAIKAAIEASPLASTALRERE